MEPTTDKEEIKKWAETRNAVPVKIPGADPLEELSFLIKDKKYPIGNFKRISWDEFFESMENKLLALQIDTDHSNLDYRFISKSNN